MDWKKNRLLIATVGFVLAVAVTAFALSNRAKRDEKGLVTEAKDKLPSIKKDDLSKITLTHPEHGKIVLKKTAEKWEVLEPVHWPADDSNMSYITDKIAELEVAGVAATSAKAHADLEVDAKKGIKVEVEADKNYAFYVGKQKGGDTMVRMDGAPEVIAARKMFRWAFDREPQLWRDRKVLDLGSDSPQELWITNSNGKFHFIKRGNTWAEADDVEKEMKVPEFDPVKVQVLLSSFTSLRVANFADGMNAAETGIEPEPAAELKMVVKEKDEKEPKTITLLVGKQIEGKDEWYVDVNGQKPLYMLDKYTADKVFSKLDDFKKDPPKPPQQGGGPMGGPGGGDLSQLPPEVRAQIQEAMKNQRPPQ